MSVKQSLASGPSTLPLLQVVRGFRVVPRVMSRGSVSVSGGAGVLPVEATLAAGRIPWSDLRFDERDEDGKLLVLGQGPLSTVLAATLTSSHTFVAVKQLPADTQLPPAAVEAPQAGTKKAAPRPRHRRLILPPRQRRCP